MDSLPNFVTHGAPRRTLRARESSAINLDQSFQKVNIPKVLYYFTNQDKSSNNQNIVKKYTYTVKYAAKMTPSKSFKMAFKYKGAWAET